MFGREKPDRYYFDRIVELTPRLTRNRLNNHGSLELCIEILEGIRKESENVIRQHDERGIEEMIKIFSSDYYNGISMGAGAAAKQDFMTRLGT